MKNKQRNSMRLILSVLFFAVGAFIISSCSKSEDPISSENSQTASNESTQESSTDETDDLATSALNGSYAASGGRVETITDDRLTCDGTTIVVTNLGANNTSGTVTITFGTNGCTDKKGNVRKGQIIVTWTGGKWYALNSSRTVTLHEYSVNGLKITGTRTVSCTNFTATSLSVFSLTWTVSAEYTLTWPDNTTAIRAVSKTKQWSHTETEDTFTESNGPGSDVAASGTNRHGKTYVMAITTPLVYKASCIKLNKTFLPVSGVKVITDTSVQLSPKVITIDFGAGTCDNTFTATFEGRSKTITAGGD